MIGLTREDSLPLPALSPQFRHCQPLSGTHCKPKQAAVDQKMTNLNIPANLPQTQFIFLIIISQYRHDLALNKTR